MAAGYPSVNISFVVNFNNESENDMRILLVENNPEMRRLLKSMIAEITDDIFESEGGEDAVEKYRTAKPDLVVMDIFRKPTNGLTSAALIKNEYPQAKIVFVSNYTDERTREWAKAAGGFAFFGKDDLLSLIGFLKEQLAEDGKTERDQNN